MKYQLALSLSLALASPVALAGEPDFLVPIETASEWEFNIETYMMATAIDGDTSIGSIQNAIVDVGFDDILDNLDMGFMVHLEAIKNNKWGAYLDYSFMDLSNRGENGLGGTVNASMRQGVLEAAVFRRFASADYTIDVFGGVRWWDNDIDLKVDSVLLPGTTSVSDDEDWVDVMMGARFYMPISEKYTLTSRLDLGGFGLESNFTATGSLGFQYHMSESVILNVRYRATWVDYEDGSSGAPGSFAYDTVTHGPYLGVNFKF